MMKLTANDGNQWKIYGVTFIPQDATCQILQKAIDGETELDQENLQRQLGYRAPIIIDQKNRVIDFHRF